jgi:hypothetical protein
VYCDNNYYILQLFQLTHDYLVIADDRRLDQMDKDAKGVARVIPCLKHSAPAVDFTEPYVFQPKPFDTKYLKMALSLAKSRGLDRRKNLSYMGKLKCRLTF